MNEKEMLECLTHLQVGCASRPTCGDVCSVEEQVDCVKQEKAIRALIVAVGEWKYRTKEALDEMENQECQGLIELAEDIRDFGEEK